MRMPAISARAHIYATECKRRAPRLTVLPQGTRHPLLQHVARAGVRLRAPTRRKPVNNARVAGAGGAQALSHSLGRENCCPCGIQKLVFCPCPDPQQPSSRWLPRAATAPRRRHPTRATISAHTRRPGLATTATTAALLAAVCVCSGRPRSRERISVLSALLPSRASARRAPVLVRLDALPLRRQQRRLQRWRPPRLVVAAPAAASPAARLQSIA